MHCREKADFTSLNPLVVPRHCPICEEGTSLETWIASWASLAPFPIWKMYCAVTARTYHSFCLVFRFPFGNTAPTCVVYLLNSCLWQRPVMLQPKSAKLCQESSLYCKLTGSLKKKKSDEELSSPLTEP